MFYYYHPNANDHHTFSYANPSLYSFYKMQVLRSFISLKSKNNYNSSIYLKSIIDRCFASWKLVGVIKGNHFIGLLISKKRNIYQVYEIRYKEMSAYRYAMYGIMMRFVMIRCVLSVLTKIQQFQKTQQQNIFVHFT